MIDRLGRLGDTTVARPCLHRIAAACPRAEPNLPVSPAAAPLEAILEPGGRVQRFVANPAGTRSVARLTPPR